MKNLFKAFVFLALVLSMTVDAQAAVCKNPKSHRPNCQQPAPTIALPQVGSASLLLSLQADALTLNDNDPVSVWPDASGNGNDFTQIDPAARPIFQANYLGFPAVHFPSGDPDYLPYWMEGGNFADNLTNFAVFAVGMYDINAGNGDFILSKVYSGGSDPGWMVELGDTKYMSVGEQGGPLDGVGAWNAGTEQGFAVFSGVINSQTEAHVFVDGNNAGEYQVAFGSAPFSLSNSEPVRLGTTGYGVDSWSTYSGWLRAVMLYQITNTTDWPADRIAIEHWLAAKYGIALP